MEKTLTFFIQVDHWHEMPHQIGNPWIFPSKTEDCTSSSNIHPAWGKEKKHVVKAETFCNIFHLFFNYTDWPKHVGCRQRKRSWNPAWTQLNARNSEVRKMFLSVEMSCCSTHPGSEGLTYLQAPPHNWTPPKNIFKNIFFYKILSIKKKNQLDSEKKFRFSF